MYSHAHLPAAIDGLFLDKKMPLQKSTGARGYSLIFV